MEFLPYPHLIATFFNRCACGPPKPFTVPSSWTWIDHPVSGPRPPTFALLRLGFPADAPLMGLLLAGERDSPDRSTKSTRSRLSHVALPPVVNTGFQVLFHSPPGVLFTFPSQYYTLSVTKEYLALGGGPPSFSQGFSCPDLLWILLAPSTFRIRDFHSLWLVFPVPFCYAFGHLLQSEPRHARTSV